jgi:two-component system chemotaxis response regulator CheB
VRSVRLHDAAGVIGIRAVRVLAVDDSAVARGALRNLFRNHPRGTTGQRVELCGVVEDGFSCLEAVRQLRPDVLLLDLEMPKMHGLDVLRTLQAEFPSLPVIMCSTYTEAGARSTLEALALGATDYVTKPAEQSDLIVGLQVFADELLLKIATLARVGGDLASGVRRLEAHGLSSRRVAANVPVQAIVIGASTGGPSALERILPDLPKHFPVPVLIAQHLPRLFTRALSERLKRCCALDVREAVDGASLHGSGVWLGPGDCHLEVVSPGLSAGKKGREEPLLRVSCDADRRACRPSVDRLFLSAVQIYGAGTLGIVLTGMGADGLTGARAIHQAGGTVLVQDEASSAVWGMPGRVYEAGITEAPVSLDKIAAEVLGRICRFGVRTTPQQTAEYVFERTSAVGPLKLAGNP